MLVLSRWRLSFCLTIGATARSGKLLTRRTSVQIEFTDECQSKQP